MHLFRGQKVGCQGEVGWHVQWLQQVLTEILGGTPVQVCIAAEIAMEHNLA